MAATTLSDATALTKVLYPYGLETILYEDCVLLGRIAKAFDFVGDSIKIPVKYGPGNKVSTSFSSSQTNTTSSSRAAFYLTTSFTNYGTVQITRQGIERCRDAGAVKSLVQDESDSVMYGLRQQIATILYGNGGGAFAVVANNNTGTNTLTVEDPDSLVGVEQGMIVRPSATDGTSGSVIADPQVIEAVDRINGTLVLTSSGGGGGANFGAGRYLFVADNFGAVAAGVGAWVPPTDPDATAFRQVNRTPDIVRLSGVRMTATPALDATIHRALIRGVSTVGKFGGKPDEVYLGTRAYQQLVNELEDKTEIQKFAKMSDGTDAKVGYVGVSIVCGKHRVTVFEDHYCAPETAWIFEMDSWKIHSVPGGFPKLIANDGNQNLRMPTSDGFEWRYVADWDLACNAPGHNGRMDLSQILAA